jgi:hypothetical protein
MTAILDEIARARPAFARIADDAVGRVLNGEGENWAIRDEMTRHSHLVTMGDLRTVLTALLVLEEKLRQISTTTE